MIAHLCIRIMRYLAVLCSCLWFLGCEPPPTLYCTPPFPCLLHASPPSPAARLPSLACCTPPLPRLLHASLPSSAARLPFLACCTPPFPRLLRALLQRSLLFTVTLEWPSRSLDTRKETLRQFMPPLSFPCSSPASVELCSWTA